MDNLIEELTAKNSEYIHAVTKQLMVIGKTDEEVKTILADILPQIIEGQKTGILAKKLLGTPQEFIQKYEPEKKAGKTTKTSNENTNPVLMWLDSSLMLFGAITAISGVLGLFSKKYQTYGLTTTVIMAAVAGIVMYMMYRFFYSQEATTRKWNWKNMFLVVAVVLVWGVLTAVTAMLPRALNPIVNSYVSIVLAVLAFGIKYLVKRQFHTRSAMTPAARVNSK
ncbi:DUF1129 domain-containing protein [Lactococcus nasutitermitis]|uniref:DUF1129 domain-containing protein n=1 Tax=Lactococcus nasutitermitis TaxID=1652957 RepID=A0ABV9JGF5_9LACT|nr:DUF1129 family protein [Lactococcus nasutitermitis]